MSAEVKTGGARRPRLTPLPRLATLIGVVSSRAIEIRRPAPGEGPQVRALRLRALSDAPEAFSSSLELELERSPAYWEHLARRSAVGDAHDESVLFVAIDDGHWAAMTASFWFDRPARIAQLWGMWVEPSMRGRGLGRRLVAQVAGWAADRGAVRLRLGVVERASEVAAFYERLGFARTGETKSLTPDDTAFFLAKELGPANLAHGAR